MIDTAQHFESEDDKHGDQMNRSKRAREKCVKMFMSLYMKVAVVDLLYIVKKNDNVALLVVTRITFKIKVSLVLRINHIGLFF